MTSPITIKEVTVANIENLQRTLDHITAHPEVHHQNHWGRVNTTGEDGGPVRPTMSADRAVQAYPSCGTSGCLAGWANVLHGWTMIGDWYSEAAGNPLFKVVPNEIARRITELTEAQVLQAAEHIEIQAYAILGLTAAEGNALFDGENQLPDLWALAYAITDGAIKLPEAFPRGKGEDDDDYLYRVDPNDTNLDPGTPEGVARLVDESMRQLSGGDPSAVHVVDDYLARNIDRIGDRSEVGGHLLNV